MPRVSVIIPAFNEEATLGVLLPALIGQSPSEILIADGESTDSTARVCERFSGTRRIPCPRGRAIQMNRAAREAKGDILLFLHADVAVPEGMIAAIERAVADPTVAGGHFDIVFAGGGVPAAIFTWINRVRYRFGIFYGDAGIFCRRKIFEQMGGYEEWPILEDYDFARRLRRFGRVASLPDSLRVSDRRWRRGGLFATLWEWFWIQALYLAGVSPHRLAGMYRNVR
ncbi:MAG: TIGR04283 family arsenosugar biosynthesis glycosyltransferase [Bryobacterales bacterium]|nr:TIGR04283 family arsenosugar biosynthesis glycosyltransferase [Bryobacterales bacterium]